MLMHIFRGRRVVLCIEGLFRLKHYKKFGLSVPVRRGRVKVRVRIRVSRVNVRLLWDDSGIGPQFFRLLINTYH